MKKCLEEVVFEASSQEWRCEFSWKTEAVFAVSSSAQGLGVRQGGGGRSENGAFTGGKWVTGCKAPGEAWIPG